MIFHEIYNVYFDAVTRILQAVVNGSEFNETLVFDTLKRMPMTNEAFGALKAGLGLGPEHHDEYQLFNADGTSRIKCCPEMPLTNIEKRWLKTILCDPRIQLFDVNTDGLEDIEPLYFPENVVVYDREGNGDPWNDINYIKHFRTILSAMQSGRKISIVWLSRESLKCRAVCLPDRFEYSELDDRMRLWADTDDAQIKVNLCRMLECEMTDLPIGLSFPPELSKPLPSAGTRRMEQEKRENFIDTGIDLSERLVLEITDERNALERAFLHFSHFQKREVAPIGEGRYRLVMSIDSDDREEMLRRVISFGPFVRVLEPEWLIVQVRHSIDRQLTLLNLL